MRPAKNHSRGFVFLDALWGLLLLLATIVLVTNVTTRAHRAALKLASDRAAVRLAETALLQRAVDANASPMARVEVRLLDTPAPTGHAWATATAIVEDRHASLTGLVLRSSATTEAAP